MRPNFFILRFQTWDHDYDTREFSSLGEFHEWADANDNADYADNPMSLVEFHGNGKRANSWSESQIDDLRDARYRELHADEIAAEKERKEAAKAKREAEEALLPPYTRNYLTELRISRDEYGNEVYAFDGIVLPFKLSDLQYTSDRPRYEEISHMGKMVAQGSVGKLTLTIPLYRGDDPEKTFRITRPMEDES
jgi:hypothetical protein